MSQGKKDKFLTGYFIGLGVIVAGLGYLAYSASDSASVAKTKYDSANAKLEMLQKQKLFPSQEHADEKARLVGTYVASVHEALKGLQSYQAPVDPAAKNDVFQSKLAAAITAIKAEAGARLPKEFDFGFSAYKSSQPSPEAAPMLTVQLDALNFLAASALSTGASIDSFKRGVLAVESQKEGSAPATAPGKGPQKPPQKSTAAGARDAKGKSPVAKAAAPPVIDEDKVLERIPVEIALTGTHKSISDYLMLLANTDPEQKQPYFIVTRAARVENSKKTGPEKSKQVTVQETPDALTKLPVKRDMEYIFGGEPVKAYLVLELIRFLPAEAATAVTPSPDKAGASKGTPVKSPSN